MKNIKTILLILTVALALTLVACAAPETCPPHIDEDVDYTCDRCGEDVPPDLSGIDLSGIKLSDVAYRYTGVERSIAIKGNLPDGVVVKYDGNGVKNAGDHIVKATFWYQVGGKEFHIEGKDLTAVIKINKSSYDVSGITFPALTVVADGKAHTPEIVGTLPEGVEVEYKGGEKTAAGSYTVTAEFVVDAINYDVPEAITTTLVIIDGPSGMGGVSYVDEKIFCDGEAKIPTVLGTPTGGWTFSHVEGGEIRLPGEYVVGLVFTNGSESFTLPISVSVCFDDSVATEGLLFEDVTGGCAVVGYTGSATVVVIPAKHGGSGVVSIASGAFMNSDVEIVYIPDSVTNIGNNAFRGATSLEYVRFSEKLKVLGSAAFRETALTDVSLPKTLVAIGHGAFESTNLTKIAIPFIGGSHNTSNPYLGYIFGADGYGGNSHYVPASLKEVVLLDSCLEIAPRAFYDCKTLEKVTIGEGVKKIGSQAFAYTAIKEIFIPDNVVEIPAKAADASVSPFFGMSSELVIKLEATNVPTGYGSVWSVIAIGKDDEKITATVVLGATRE